MSCEAKVTSVRQGKVRKVTTYDDDTILLETTDRVSAFDHVFPELVPLKGEILNKMSWFVLQKTKDIVPNWADSCPTPTSMKGKQCEPFMIEVILRRYLIGSAWRSYRDGSRNLCGVELPDGLTEGHRFENPIVTPTTKTENDEPITPEEITKQGLATKYQWDVITDYARKLFKWGEEYATTRDLILCDTKFEFGIDSNGNILLIDECLTVDSSRYLQVQPDGSKKTLSKEFLRKWLMDKGFQNAPGQTPPKLPETLLYSITGRYCELYSLFVSDD